jgi:hypothetical protein
MFNNLSSREWLTLALLIVILAGAAVGLVWMAVGLFRARSLIRREFSAYFLSPIAYVVLVVFLFVTGDLFATTLGLLTAKGPVGTESPMQTMFGDKLFWLVFLFIPPLLTMRLFAEERSSGTLEMLMTAPLRDWQVVLCKYLACLAFYTVLWLPTLLYLPALLGAQMPVYDSVWTVESIVFVSGLASVLLGLLLLLPQLGTMARLVSLVLIGGGGAAAGIGGWLHYHADEPHLLEIPVLLDPISGAVDLCWHVPGRGDVPGHRSLNQQPGAQSDGGRYPCPGGRVDLHWQRLLATGTGRLESLQRRLLLQCAAAL